MLRRDVLRLGVGGGAVGALGALTSCATTIPAPTRVFSNGVASGLHSPDEVVLWTRVAPEKAAGNFTVTWEVATDDTFSSVVATGTETATAATDHTVKVLASGLEGDRSHWYRFRHPGEDAAVGRARTLPAPGPSTACL